MTAAVTPTEVTTALEDLDKFLVDRHLNGSWFQNTRANNPLPKPEPRPGYEALHWRWADLYPGLLESGRLVPVGAPPNGLTAMRSIRGVGAAQQAINMNAQILMPGERTHAHHNLRNETRLVHEAPEGAVFVCDGEAFPMERGDVIISPSWSDHDHYNGGDAPAVWVDGYDDGYSKLGADLNTRFPADSPYQEIRQADGYSLKTLGRVQPTVARVRSTGHVTTPFPPRPAMRYPWTETKAALDALLANGVAPDPFDGVALMFVNPVDGGPTLPTFAWHVAVLAAGFIGATHRHNSTTCYHVFEGSGATTIEGQRVDWATGDLFVVPPWTWHSHEISGSSDAVLFSIDDWPARTTLGFYAKEEQE